MSYVKTNWVNGPDTATPITADRLNNLETQHDAALTQVATDIADSSSPIGTRLNATFVARGFGQADFPKWRKALSRVRTGAGDAKLLCVGDSTVAGAYNASWPLAMTNLLDTSGTPYVTGLAIPPHGAITDDPRWTTSGSWPFARNFGFGGYSGWSGDDTSGNLVFADPTVLADRFDVFYVDNPSLGTGTFTATGGSATPVVCGGSFSIKKATISAAVAATTNTLTLTASANGFYLLGVEPWLSTVSRVRVGNAGVPQSAAADWVAGAPFGGVDAITAYAPDLTLISLGVNDGINGTAADTYLTQVQSIATAAAVTGDVIFATPIPSQSPSSEATLEPQYRTALLGADGAIIDVFAHLVSWDEYNALGYMLDGHHPNPAGYADLGAYYKHLLAGIA